MPDILAIYGSPRRKGNTSELLRRAVKGAVGAGARVEEVVLRDLKMSPCLEIYGCKEAGRCMIQDDFQKMHDRLEEADGILLATPVFFYAVSAHTKILMDRCQSLWVKRYWIEKADPKTRRHHRKGALISVGATRGKRLFEGVQLSVRYFFDALGVEMLDALLVRGCDAEGDILHRPDSLEAAARLGRRLALSLSPAP
jgi:multimeric flavodoxin WrbA